MKSEKGDVSFPEPPANPREKDIKFKKGREGLRHVHGKEEEERNANFLTH